MLDLLKHWRMVLTFALLYLSQGICFGIAMDALPTLLRHDGAALHALAFLPLVGIPWVVKFLWAPRWITIGAHAWDGAAVGSFPCRYWCCCALPAWQASACASRRQASPWAC